MKKIVLLLLALLLITPAVFADEGIGEIPHYSAYGSRILQNGHYLDLVPNADTVDENGELFIPLRVVLETGGIDLSYDAQARTVCIDNQLIFSLIDGSANATQFPFYVENGTTYVDIRFFQLIPDLTVSWDPATWTVIVDSARDKTGVEHYNLGTRTLTTTLGKELTYSLIGGIKVPEKDHNPLVIFLHGCHNIEKSDENRYDLGFSYLMNDLAEKGYASISMNVNIQFSFEDGEPIADERVKALFAEQIKALIAANNGEDVGFRTALKDKIDFNNVILIGHSRSGQQIFELYQDMVKKMDIRPKGLLSIAPALTWDYEYTEQIDAPVSIILPELDGDVIIMDGQQIFDSLIEVKERKAETQLVYLYGANHNAFNQALLKQDAGKNWYKGEVDYMPNDKQRVFMVNYAEEFISRAIEGRSIADLGSHNEMLGFKALTDTYVPGERLYSAQDGIKAVTATSAKAKPLILSFIPAENTAGLFNHPGGHAKLPLLNMTWEKKGGKVTFASPATTWDLSSFNKLDLYIGQDSTNPLCAETSSPFTVTLTDQNGKSAAVYVDDTNLSLVYKDGQVIDFFADAFYTTHTPMGIIRLNLRDFDGVDLHHIKDISLGFDDSDSGSLMLNMIQASPSHGK